jgi:uncharacterized protein (DUF2141 family)
MNNHKEFKLKTIFALTFVGLILFTNVTTAWTSVFSQDYLKGIKTPETTARNKSEIDNNNPYFSIDNQILSDGTSVSKYLINGPSSRPVDLQSQQAPLAEPISGADVLLSDFPSYSWVFGCGAVSGAMVAAYYDRNGYPNIYTGQTNAGIMPLTDSSWGTWNDGYKTYVSNPLVASQIGIDGRTTRGSIEDYWVKEGSSEDDPYITNGWAQHSWGTAIGDYTKTSQSAYKNKDGFSVIWTYTSSNDKYHCNDMDSNAKNSDITFGMKEFYENRGYSLNTCYNQSTDNLVSGGFSLADYQNEINAGHPVLISLRGHFVIGYGYDGFSSDILIRDTWDSDPTQTYRMTWGGTYSNMEMLAVGVIHLNPPPISNHLLTVNKSGNGTGLVISNPAGINCGSTCSASFASGTTVTLTAVPDPGLTFSGWSGACSGTSTTCQVTLTQALSVTASFSTSVITNYSLDVYKSGNGTGLITSNPAGINCGSTCSASFASGTTVTLTAIPDPGSTFSGWLGACGLNPTCQVTMTQSMSVSASFSLASPTDYTLDIFKSGSGNGLITSNPAGINCGSTCSASFPSGSTVTLTAVPDPGSTFGGWLGACSGLSPICQVTMSQAFSVIATFNLTSTQIFSDVLPSHWAYNWISQLYNTGITAGCGTNPLRYCPSAPVTRAQMAIFLLRAKYGSQYTPNAVGSTTGFLDVEPDDFAAAWIKKLADEGITAGCGGGNYCPNSPVTRAQMAIFLLRAKNGASYTPPTSGIPVELIQDPSFEAGTPNPVWLEYSENFDTPICTIADCSNGDGYAGPRTGEVWVWLGGIADYEYGFVEQTLLIPTDASNLQFYFWMGTANYPSTTDLFWVEIDGVEVFWADATMLPDYSAYTPVNIDIKAFADGNQHTITFSSITNGQIVNFNLDDISISSSGDLIPTFSDVPQTHFAFSWIEQLYKDEITSGVAPGTYGPEQGVTRAQMAVFLLRMFSLQ